MFCALLGQDSGERFQDGPLVFKTSQKIKHTKTLRDGTAHMSFM